MSEKKNNKKKKDNDNNTAGYELTKGSKVLIVLICIMSAVALYVLSHAFPAYLNAGLP